MTQPPAPENQIPATPAPVPPLYEFTQAQNDIIRSLSRKMMFVGIFYVIASGLVGIAGLIALFVMPVVGLVYLILLIPELLIGIWTIHAAHSFRLVVDTRGHDIPHLMGALTSLRKLYTLMFWLLVVAVIVMVLAVAAGIILWTMGLIPGTQEASAYTSLGAL